MKRASVYTVSGEILLKSASRLEALKIALFARRPVIWENETLGTEYI